MLWFLILIVPLLIFGFIVDRQKKKRLNTNHDANKPHQIDTKPSAHHSMGENIRGGN
ncbi:hypothetical protein [Virgibacillus doumboii]|uniref:hypothetical protein n=1 Tax=Virgibacillus doumboii TaxID=2697503 RepID=UPI0013E0360B|nr:hypothetical protein [Virgibacillus doumboii]